LCRIDMVIRMISQPAYQDNSHQDVLVVMLLS